MNKPASGKQSQLDDEKEHARLGQPGWHERRIRDVSPGGSLIACSARLIVKLLLPDAGLLFCKAKAGGRLVRARLPAKSMNSVFEREPCAERKRKSGPGPGSVRARLPAKPMNSVFEREPCVWRKRKSGPGAGEVRARLPAKPMNWVFVRELCDGKRGK